MAPNTRSGIGPLPEGNPTQGYVEPEEVLTPGSTDDDPMDDAQRALSISDLIEETAFERDEDDMETGPEPGTLAGNGPPVQPTAAAPAPEAGAPVVNARVPSGLARINALNARYEKLKAEKE
ncbi:hypothetical protein MMC22_002320 [Lobaria immixta]|nr:hypothetical protein [Lobaria immixta]